MELPEYLIGTCCYIKECAGFKGLCGVVATAESLCPQLDT